MHGAKNEGLAAHLLSFLKDVFPEDYFTYGDLLLHFLFILQRENRSLYGD